MNQCKDLILVGWNEWIGLPDLGLSAVHAKIDTGARTSALHAYDIAAEEDASGRLMVRFSTHPDGDENAEPVQCVQPVKDRREVKNSGGLVQMRYVIETRMHIGAREWRVQLTLTNRKRMKFPMLIGRQALNNRALVNPVAACVQGGQPSDPSAPTLRRSPF